MQLSLTEAATLLGRTERQIRSMIEDGRIVATKSRGKWQIDRDSLALITAQGDSPEVGMEDEELDFDEIESPPMAGDRRKTWSVTDLDAFRLGVEILHDLRSIEAPRALELLDQCLEVLGCGCHDFNPRSKRVRFAEARDAAARAAVRLIADGDGDALHESLARRIETDLIPRLGGLVASQDRRTRRGR